MAVALDRIGGAVERLLGHALEHQHLRGRLVRRIGFAEDGQRRERPLRTAEPPVDLRGVEDDVAVVGRDRHGAVEIGQRFLGPAPGEYHLAVKPPGFVGAGSRPHRLARQPVGVVEQAEFHVHPAAIDAEAGVARREPQRLSDLGHRRHPFATLPEHVGIVPSRVDIGGAVLDRLLQEPLGPQQVLAVCSGKAFVAEAAGVGDLLRHGARTGNQPAARSRHESGSDSAGSGDEDSGHGAGSLGCPTCGTVGLRDGGGTIGFRCGRHNAFRGGARHGPPTTKSPAPADCPVLRSPHTKAGGDRTCRLQAVAVNVLL